MFGGSGCVVFYKIVTTEGGGDESTKSRTEKIHIFYVKKIYDYHRTESLPLAILA